jgi:hypothetical protein
MPDILGNGGQGRTHLQIDVPSLELFTRQVVLVPVAAHLHRAADPVRPYEGVVEWLGVAQLCKRIHHGPDIVMRDKGQAL